MWRLREEEILAVLQCQLVKDAHILKVVTVFQVLCQRFHIQGTQIPKEQLFGKKAVFTGKLTSMDRREACQLTVDVGARPVESASGKTDYADPPPGV